jgi:hypothetical protein
MKRLAWWLGRHDWTTRVEGGESYKVCTACGKTPRASAAQGPRHTDLTGGDGIGNSGGVGGIGGGMGT